MHEFNERWPQNVRGKIFVDEQCLDCDLCREIAPTVFKRNDAFGHSYVAKQPENEEEMNQAIEASENCCVESIGIEGDQYDWDKTPPISTNYMNVKPSFTVKEYSCCNHPKKDKPWWKFWGWKG